MSVSLTPKCTANAMRVIIDSAVKEKKELNFTAGNQDAAPPVKDWAKEVKANEKRRRSSMSTYTPEFKAEVTVFGLMNSWMVTSKKLMFQRLQWESGL